MALINKSLNSVILIFKKVKLCSKLVFPNRVFSYFRFIKNLNLSEKPFFVLLYTYIAIVNLYHHCHVICIITNNPIMLLSHSELLICFWQSELEKSEKLKKKQILNKCINKFKCINLFWEVYIYRFSIFVLKWLLKFGSLYVLACKGSSQRSLEKKTI